LESEVLPDAGNYRSFDPLTDKDRLNPRQAGRFREIIPPPGLTNWQHPGFDASQWQS
jgi:hypothetical protein